MAANSEKTARAPRGKPFQKGQSGNPNGRPKIAEEFRDRCRKVVDDTVFQAWKSEVEGGGEDWMEASKLLSAYGYGKPAQTIELGNSDDKPLSVQIIRKVRG